MQPIQIYMAPKGTGPNPWKVILVLAELDIDFKINWISYADIKSEPYVSLNPVGRLPAMVDTNNNITLFESGAIIEYIIGAYDQKHKLSYGEDRMQEKWGAHSWLMFQMSGQGPMFGQRMWFLHFHRDKGLQSALDRYGTEVIRITGVIDSHLKKKAAGADADSAGELWLAGDKCTFADLSFVMWNTLLMVWLFPDEDAGIDKKFPYFYQWHENLVARPAVKRILEMRAKLMEELEDQDTAQAVIARQNAGP
jgi:glutathione S-transferase